MSSKQSHFSSQEIAKLLKSARRVLKHPGFDFLIAPSFHDSGRILVITPKQIGNAPERNKIRRQIKALFYEEKLLERPYDYIVIIKKEGIGLSFQELKKLILDALNAFTL